MICKAQSPSLLTWIQLSAFRANGLTATQDSISLTGEILSEFPGKACSPIPPWARSVHEEESMCRCADVPSGLALRWRNPPQTHLTSPV
ncbi:unnamed protein product [Rangifer tarandus platyrhynchus]|uniref:Uncharacterized protein n=1 Tax=Rangifer tarandus platyrhynchus TaxID=3082113 RepID=A0AC59ZET3_RANTA